MKNQYLSNKKKKNFIRKGRCCGKGYVLETLLPFQTFLGNVVFVILFDTYNLYQ